MRISGSEARKKEIIRKFDSALDGTGFLAVFNEGQPVHDITPLYL